MTLTWTGLGTSVVVPLATTELPPTVIGMETDGLAPVTFKV